ncbi:hypothetical protein [Corallococcus sp. CA054B]|uniref:hypothetical protein n=1 Tax=Corallococcus sp. CA054B TaxID=2316734 RepID=UPI0011C3FFE0|nr:hypothetical protein [Corallococcus sp. CA054B]
MPRTQFVTRAGHPLTPLPSGEVLAVGCATASGPFTELYSPCAEVNARRPGATAPGLWSRGVRR